MALARTNPDLNLLPHDPEIEARVGEILAYVEGTIHGQGYGRLFKPSAFEPQDILHGKLGLGQSAVTNQERGIIETGFAILDSQLGRHRYAVSDDFTIADAALFYVERWACPQDIDLPINVAANLERMLARATVSKVGQIWGELD